jgi:hypothetical protein
MENNGGDEPNQSILYAYVKMSQRNPLYNYHIQTNKFFKKLLCILVAVMKVHEKTQ